MSTFDIRNDAPGLLRTESLNITLKFDRTSDSTGRISWNIPTAAQGCLSGTQAYNGMVVVIDTTSPSVHHKPINATVYQSDNNINANLFVGDTIGTAKVIGTFYNDTTTTYFDVSGLLPNTPYYISGYPVDAQYRYYVEGVHAFSQNYDIGGSGDTSGYQVIVFNPDSDNMGVKLTDATQLVPGINYSFKMQVGYVYNNKVIDKADCNPVAPTYTVTINGTNNATYGDLLVSINRSIAVLQGGVQSPVSPNTGAFFLNNNILYQWDGSSHVIYDPFISSSTQPNNAVVDTMWYTKSSDTLKTWNGSPLSWNSTSFISFASDPTQPIQNVTYWFNGNQGYSWNGATWCSVDTYIQVTNPSIDPILPPASYWYDGINAMLYQYDNILQMWNAVTAIQYHLDPNALPIGTYWYDETNKQLNLYAVGWTIQTNTTISENEPSTPYANRYWYNPITEVLKQRNSSNTAWNTLDVLSFPTDPTNRQSCELWWNTQSDVLYTWDDINSEWIEITSFYQQSIDPSLAPVLHEGNMWYDGTIGYIWNGTCFVVCNDIIFSVQDPRYPSNGTIWHNTDSDMWYIRTGSPSMWIAPTYPVLVSEQDPYTPAVGTAWYDTNNMTLNIWNGISWILVGFSETPYTPVVGTLWYDTTNQLLKQWASSGWKLATPFVLCEYDCNGNFKFTDTSKGSNSLIRLTDENLFASLDAPFKFHTSYMGEDGVSGTPSYMEIGVGTDGSNDERLKLHSELRMELGYPAVQVELTNEQLDFAIDSALQELRTRSGAAYRHGFFFVDVPANTHTIYLTNKNKELNKIVDVLGVYRATSSFLSSAHGAGVYGQIVLQHLYNMGTFDLLSYHIMSEYTKLMELLFAAKVVYTFNEQRRELNVFNRFPYNERLVCIEASVERLEQEIITDRRCRPWIRKWAGAQCRMMLAESRGKFSTLPGAGGSITLNANELRQQAKDSMAECLKDIEDMIVDNWQQYGAGAHMTFG